jgi:hypothetical protein
MLAREATDAPPPNVGRSAGSSVRMAEVSTVRGRSATENRAATRNHAATRDHTVTLSNGDLMTCHHPGGAR